MNGWFHQHGFPRPRQDSRQQRLLQPEEIWAITQEPMLRWPDVPGGELLAAPLMVEPNDPVLQELFGLTAREQMAKAMISGDPYHGNYPQVGIIPQLAAGRIPLLTMPTGDVLSTDIPGLTKNVLVVGPTGGGKTNWLRVLIAALLEAS